MRLLQILLLGIFITIPTLGNSAVVFHPKTITKQQVETSPEKKEKPRKKFRKWIRSHQLTIIFGMFFLGGLAMVILGILNQIRWLWLLGLFTMIAPWILAIMIVFIVLSRGDKRKSPHLAPDTEVQEKEKR